MGSSLADAQPRSSDSARPTRKRHSSASYSDTLKHLGEKLATGQLASMSEPEYDPDDPVPDDFDPELDEEVP